MGDVLRFSGKRANLGQGWGSSRHINAVAAWLVSEKGMPLERASARAVELLHLAIKLAEPAVPSPLTLSLDSVREENGSS